MDTLIILIRYVLLYLIIISGSIFIANKANKKIEKCIAPNIAIIILTLYIFGLFELLKYGVWVASILNLVLGLYSIIKNRKNIKERILTPGLTFFSMVFFILMLISLRKNLVDYDHFFYRSLNTKIMYYTDCMSKGFENLYPPAINLFQYYCTKIIGTYLQGTEALATQIFGFALLLPLFDRIKNTKFINTIVTIIVICVPAIFASLIFYESAYPDAILGLLIGYSIYTLYTEKNNKFKAFAVCCSLIITTLIKPIGFYVSGIIIGIYLLIELLNNKCNTKQNIIKFLKTKEFKIICILIITVLITFMSWKVFTKINNQYNNGVSRDTVSINKNYLLKNILMTTFGYYEENHDSADSNYTLIPKLNSVVAIYSPIKISIYGAIVLLMFAMLITYKRLNNKEDKEKYKNYVIALTVGLGIYIILIQMSYILKFSNEEMLGHNGIDRYMPTFLLGMLYFVVAVVLDNMEKIKDRKINYLIVVAIIIALTPLKSIANVTITAGIYDTISIEYCNNGRVPATQIDEKIEQNEVVISINQKNEDNIFNLMIRYYLYPEHKTYIYNEIKTEEKVENLKNKILNENCNYIFIYTSDETLEKLFKDKFEYEGKLENETLYKVNVENDSIKLEKIDISND
jgi:hypothetical protein